MNDKGVEILDAIIYSCLAGSIIFWVMAAIFAVLKEKAAILISGFNTLPKEQRKQYDTRRMSRDMRNGLALWAFVLGMGGALAYVFSSTGAAVISIIVWLILFFREVHLDEEKAFGKYKLR